VSTNPIPPALTPEEWRDGEFDAFYGNRATSLQVDYKGRVFAYSEARDVQGAEAEIVILNEPHDATRVLPKIIALSNNALQFEGHPGAFTPEDVDLIRRASIIFRVGDLETATDERATERLHRGAEKIAAYLPPE
jgi:hypothetical protein